MRELRLRSKPSRLRLRMAWKMSGLSILSPFAITLFQPTPLFSIAISNVAAVTCPFEAFGARTFC